MEGWRARALGYLQETRRRNLQKDGVQSVQCVGEHRTEERTAEERAASSLQAACPLLAHGLGHSRRGVRLYLILLNALLLLGRRRLLLIIPRSATAVCSPPPAPTRRSRCRMCCPVHSVRSAAHVGYYIYSPTTCPCPRLSVSHKVSLLSSLLSSPVSSLHHA